MGHKKISHPFYLFPVTVRATMSRRHLHGTGAPPKVRRGSSLRHLALDELESATDAFSFDRKVSKRSLVTIAELVQKLEENKATNRARAHSNESAAAAPAMPACDAPSDEARDLPPSSETRIMQRLAKLEESHASGVTAVEGTQARTEALLAEVRAQLSLLTRASLPGASGQVPLIAHVVDG